MPVPSARLLEEGDAAVSFVPLATDSSFFSTEVDMVTTIAWPEELSLLKDSQSEESVTNIRRAERAQCY